jgi:hypothetical protein
MKKSISTLDGLLVKFLEVVKKHAGQKTHQMHYKVCAEVQTTAGKSKQEYWYVENSAFLRQRSQKEGAKATRVGFSEKQRSEIAALVKKFDVKK